MLTGRVKTYTSSCLQAVTSVTHRSTNRARRRATSFPPKRVTIYATVMQLLCSFKSTGRLHASAVLRNVPVEWWLSNSFSSLSGKLAAIRSDSLHWQGGGLLNNTSLNRSFAVILRFHTRVTVNGDAEWKSTADSSRRSSMSTTYGVFTRSSKR